MEREYNKTMVSKVFYMNENRDIKEIYFEEKTIAEEYIRIMNAITGYEKFSMNVWQWEVMIEK